MEGVLNKIVVTGSTSMLGAATIAAALNNGVETVYAIIRQSTNRLERLPADDRIHYVVCDIDEYYRLPELIHEECSVFYHFAWAKTGSHRNDDAIGQACNIEYTIEAINAAYNLGCNKFVGAGSQAEYGKLDLEKFSPDSPVNPEQSYGIAKYAAGKFARFEAERLGISCLWVRIFSVYGEHDKPTTMISSAVKKMLNHERVSFTPAEQRWEYLYSGDAGEALYLIGEKSNGNKVYCLGTGQARPLKEYIEMIRDAIDPSLELGIGDIPYSSSTVMNICADISNLIQDTGWKPKTSFCDGIHNIIKEYVKQQ